MHSPFLNILLAFDKRLFVSLECILHSLILSRQMQNIYIDISLQLTSLLRVFGINWHYRDNFGVFTYCERGIY